MIITVVGGEFNKDFVPTQRCLQIAFFVVEVRRNFIGACEYLADYFPGIYVKFQIMFHW